MAWRSIQARLGVIQGNRYHPCFNIKSDGNTKGVVFFMHGLGDMGMGWAQLFAMQAHPNVRYVFPSANHMPVTLNMGMDMPSWFDIKNLSHDDNDRYDRDGLNEAATNITEIVDGILSEENLTRNELVLGGFSQGGALAYHTAFNHFDSIGGLLIMSSWLCDSETVLSKYKNGVKLPGPISHHHGDIDPMVPHFMAVESTNALKELTSNDESLFKFTTYTGLEHSSCDEEMKDADSFISRCLNLSNSKTEL